jgi:hypothetical protein
MPQNGKRAIRFGIEAKKADCPFKKWLEKTATLAGFGCLISR